jgi:hypothetical protein
MAEEKFSEQEGLALIESMIHRAKGEFSENGQLYLLWGWLVFFCSITQFIIQYFFHRPDGSIVWTLTWVAAIYSTWVRRKDRKRTRVRTYTDEIIAYVWLTFVLSLFIILFVITFRGGGPAWQRTSPAILCTYAIPSFLSGIILRFRPLILGGLACWALAIITLFLPLEFQILMLALAMVIAWIIPGYKLRARFRRSRNSSAATLS